MASEGKKLRVVFLDIDGVVHPVEEEDVNRLFLPHCLTRLQRLLTCTGAVVVLSSNWRLEDDMLEEAKSCLAEFAISIHDTTPLLAGRATEILTWLRDHRDEVCAFVVLDDMDLCPPSVPTAMGRALGAENCIVVDGLVGLTDDDIARAIQLLTADPEGAHERLERSLAEFEKASSKPGAPKIQMMPFFVREGGSHQ
eukprot:gnl/TRDRNA2_/TRDRNA2_206588_c0_seq1.p1 gnl/TRDRNA2_/TRDRNA2_206588_c0~~gnl/TRDRNA2_/TRDRNA2_206588_c0_seq1.p1  ORF type:complete len:197 (-),score=29.73 gnl/TRDRNA2_/TRDRNA2_206588_c0_seq1:70-660(-)